MGDEVVYRRIVADRLVKSEGPRPLARLKGLGGPVLPSVALEVLSMVLDQTILLSSVRPLLARRVTLACSELKPSYSYDCASSTAPGRDKGDGNSH